MNKINKAFNKLSYIYEGLKWKCKISKLGKNPRIGKHLKVVNPQYLTIGNNVQILDNVTLTMIPLNDHHKPSLVIKDGVRIQKWCDIGCGNNIIINENCNIGPYVHIVDRDHIYEDPLIPVKKQGNYSKGAVIIKEGTWVGFRAQILSNVTIGKHCVIAAGSVVTKDVPDYCVVAGNPARIVKSYNWETKTWQKIKNEKCIQK